MAITMFYRGGDTPVKTPLIRIGRNTKYFGQGYYCTIIKEQTQRWAKRYDTKIVSSMMSKSIGSFWQSFDLSMELRL